MSSATSPIRVRTLNSIDAVDAASWDALCGRMARPTFFNSHAWSAAWNEHFGEERQVLMLAAEREGELVGLLPLSVKSQQRLVFKRRLLTPLAALSMTAAQYLGPICAREDDVESLSENIRSVGWLNSLKAIQAMDSLPFCCGLRMHRKLPAAARRLELNAAPPTS